VIAYDWECKRAKETLARALAALEETSSGIVLLHDIHRHTADALPMFLTALAERGYSVVTPVVGPRAVGAETAPGLASEPAG